MRGASRRPEPVGSWQTAVAGIRAEGDFGQKTACGLILRSDTDGVSHGVLPCGAKIFISYGDRTVLTQVIDRGPSSPGRVFDLTPSVAAKLGVRSTARVRWAFAGTP